MSVSISEEKMIVYKDFLCSNEIGIDRLTTITNQRVGKVSLGFLEESQIEDYCFEIVKENKAYKFIQAEEMDFGLYYKIPPIQPISIKYDYYINIGNTWIYVKKLEIAIQLIQINKDYNIVSITNAKIGDVVMIGSKQSCQVQIENDDLVSTIHSKIQLKKECITIEDVGEGNKGSRYGTWVQFKNALYHSGVLIFRFGFEAFAYCSIDSANSYTQFECDSIYTPQNTKTASVVNPNSNSLEEHPKKEEHHVLKEEVKKEEQPKEAGKKEEYKNAHSNNITPLNLSQNHQQSNTQVSNQSSEKNGTSIGSSRTNQSTTIPVGQNQHISPIVEQNNANVYQPTPKVTAQLLQSKFAKKKMHFKLQTCQIALYLENCCKNESKNEPKNEGDTAEVLLGQSKMTDIDSTSMYDEILSMGYDEDDIKLLSILIPKPDALMDYIMNNKIEVYKKET